MCGDAIITIPRNKAALEFVENGPANWTAIIETLSGVLDDYDAQVSEYENAAIDYVNEWIGMHDWFLETKTGEDAWNAYLKYDAAIVAYNDASDALNEFKELYSRKYIMDWVGLEYFDLYYSFYEMFYGRGYGIFAFDMSLQLFVLLKRLLDRNKRWRK